MKHSSVGHHTGDVGIFKGPGQNVCLAFQNNCVIYSMDNCWEKKNNKTLKGSVHLALFLVLFIECHNESSRYHVHPVAISSLL